MSFQFYNLVPSLTARENVQLVTDVAPEPDARQRGLGTSSALASAWITSRRSCPAANNSVSPSPAPSPNARRSCLCDEPTGALGQFTTGVQVLEVLRDINERFGTTTVVITHNAEIQRMAHRVIFFQDGKIVKTEVNEHRLAPSEIAW